MSSNLKVMETKSIYFKNLEELIEVFLVDERNKKNALTLGNKTGFHQFKTNKKNYNPKFEKYVSRKCATEIKNWKIKL